MIQMLNILTMLKSWWVSSFVYNTKPKQTWNQNSMHSIGSTRWTLGHAVTLNFDLLMPKIEAFIPVQKRINAESLVKFSAVIFNIHVNEAKKCIFQHARPTVTMNFDLLTPKVDGFVLVPKCTNAESLEKISPILVNTLC